LSPLTLVPGSKCRIRLDNLEFQKISKDFSFYKDPHHFMMDLKYFLREVQGVFFYLCFYNVFFALWSFSHGLSFVFAQFFASQSVLKLFIPLIVLTTNFGDDVELFYWFYLFSLRDSSFPLSMLISALWCSATCRVARPYQSIS